MKKLSAIRLKGVFQHLVYSPGGEIEGIMLEADNGPAQIVFAHDDDYSPAQFRPLKAGQSVTVDVEAAEPSAKGSGEHEVYDFGALLSVNGKPPAKRITGSVSGYRGRVKRFNYARHGAINGVVLDSGDFLHLKPDNYARLGLKIGDRVVADGDAQQLADGRGWAVEATVINGRRIAKR